MNDAVCIIEVGCAMYGVVAPELDDADAAALLGHPWGSAAGFINQTEWQHYF